jgi:type IVB pilus formation R64 PilN family outer membrane protein
MKLRILGALVGAFLISACSTFEHVDKVERRADERFEEAATLNKQTREVPTPSRETVRYLDAPWVSLKPITIADKKDEPILHCRVKIATLEPVSILELGQIVTKYCGVPVRVTPDALSAIESPSSEAAATPAGTSGATPLTPSASTASATKQSGSPESKLIDINYHGELAGLLDMVAARYGISWKVDDGRIKLFSVDTATFYLHTIATTTEMQSAVVAGTTMLNGSSSSSSSGGSSGSSSGVGGTSGSTQNTTVSLKTSIWTDVKSSIDTMKSARGRVSISPATGAITVTDTTEVLDRVSGYVKRENENLTKQVFFSIKVLAVSSNTDDNMSISWQAVWRSVSSKYGFALDSTIGAVTNGANGTLSIVSGANSPWAGTNAIIGALNEQGRVMTVREPTASTLNLQPVSVQVAKRKGFLAGQTSTTTANVGTTDTLTTGVVTTGFNMSLLPYVMEDNRLLLLFSVNLSSLQNLRTVTSGKASAEVPEIDLPINSTQQVRLKAGDTLVMAGFDQEDGASTRTGAGHAENWLFGGGVKGSKGKSTLVVLITPVIME